MLSGPFLLPLSTLPPTPQSGLVLNSDPLVSVSHVLVMITGVCHHAQPTIPLKVHERSLSLLLFSPLVAFSPFLLHCGGEDIRCFVFGQQMLIGSSLMAEHCEHSVSRVGIHTHLGRPF